MAKSKSIPDQALVVVADGGKAILFRRIGPGPEVILEEMQHLTPDSTSEQGPSGSRPESQTPKQTDEASFANHLGSVLHTMLQQKHYTDLVLIADPQTLGQLRSCLHKTVESAVVFSLSKDLTNHPLKEIESALTE